MQNSEKVSASANSPQDSTVTTNDSSLLGVNNVSMVTVAVTGTPGESGREWEERNEKQHDNDPRKSRKLVFFADEKNARASLNGMYVVPTDIYHLAKAVKPTWTDSNAKTWDQEIHYQHGIGAKHHQFISNQ